MKRQRVYSILTLVMAATLAEPAWAHHVMGGRLPTAWWQGLLSGLGHPLIGPDHFAFMVGAALIAVGRPRAALMLAAFVAASTAGVLLHLALFNLPLVEPVIAISVLLFGLGVLALWPISDTVLTILLATAGLFHGYAFGESIVGAEQSPLVAYMIGLGVIQYAVMLATLSLAQYLGMPRSRAMAYQGVGAMIAVVGIVFLGISVA